MPDANALRILTGLPVQTGQRPQRLNRTVSRSPAGALDPPYRATNRRWHATRASVETNSVPAHIREIISLAVRQSAET